MKTNNNSNQTNKQAKLAYDIQSFIDHCLYYDSDRHRVAEYLWIRCLLLPDVFTSLDTIADDLKICSKTVVRSLNDLVKINLIERIKRPLKDGKFNAWQSNLYRLNPLARTHSYLQEFSTYFSSLGSYLYYQGKIIIQAAIKEAKEKMKNIPRVFDANAHFFNGGVPLIFNSSYPSYFNSVSSLKGAAKKNTDRTKKSGSFQTRIRVETSYDPQKGNVQDFLFRSTVIKMSKIFRLSLAATAHIAAYPDELLTKVLARWDYYNRARPGMKLRNKFRWLSSVLRTFSKEGGYWISIELAKALRSYLNVSDDLAAKTRDALPHETIIPLFQAFVKGSPLPLVASITPPVAAAPPKTIEVATKTPPKRTYTPEEEERMFKYAKQFLSPENFEEFKKRHEKSSGNSS